LRAFPKHLAPDEQVLPQLELWRLPFLQRRVEVLPVTDQSPAERASVGGRF
jgi:hypothetical protein